MKNSAKRKNIVILSIFAALFLILSFVFISANNNKAQKVSADAPVFEKVNGSYANFGWALAATGSATSSFDASTGYTKISNLNSWGTRMYFKKPVKLDGATISIYSDGLLTSGVSQDVVGFALGANLFAYPTESTISKFCVSYWQRLWNPQSRLSIAYDHCPQNIPSQGSNHNIAFPNQDLTGNICSAGVPEYVFDCTSEFGVSMTFEYVNASLWKITTKFIKGSAWAQNIAVSYVSSANILPANNTSGKSTEVYLAAYGYKGDDSPATEIHSYVKVEDADTRKADTSCSYNEQTDYTSFTGLNTYGNRFTLTEKVKVDGLSISLKNDNVNPAYGNVYGFGFIKDKTAFSLDSKNSFNAIVCPKLFGDADSQISLLMATNHEQANNIAFKDKGLKEPGFGLDTRYVLNFSTAFEIRLDFKLVAESNVYQVDITVINGSAYDGQVNTVYFAKSYIDNVLTDGTCYLSALGWTVNTVPSNMDLKITSGYKITEIADGITNTVIVKKGDAFKFNQYNSSEKLNYAWTVGGKSYAVGDSFVPTSDTTINAKYLAFTQATGASVLKSGTLENSGIRFQNTLSEQGYSSSQADISAIGIIVMPIDLIKEDKDFTYENYSGDVVKFELNKSDFKFKSGSMDMFGSIVDVHSFNYNRKFAARSFVTVSLNDKTLRAYTDYMPYYNTRTISEVSGMAIDAGEEDPNNVLTIYNQGALDVTYADGNYSVNVASRTPDTKKIVKGISGITSGQQITLSITVDTALYSSLLNGKFFGLTYNGTRIKTPTFTLSNNVVTCSFNKPAGTIDLLSRNFWDGDTMYDESILLVADTDASGKVISAPKGKLIFPANEILELKWYYHNDRAGMKDPTVILKEGVDFKYENGYIVALGSITPDGNFSTSLPWVKDKHLTGEDPNFPNLSSKQIKNKNNPNWYIPFTENNEVLQLQLYVTYTHEENLWTGTKQAYAGNGSLKKVVDKMKRGENINYLVVGASESTGANTSGYLGINPYMDDWMTQVKKGLESYYGIKVNYYMRASGGTSAIDAINGGRGWINHGHEICQPPLSVMLGIATWSQSQINELKAKYPNAEYLGETYGNIKFDLVSIEYGINDCGLYTPDQFKTYMDTLFSWIFQANPDCCIVNNGGMLVNPISANHTTERDNDAKQKELCNKYAQAEHVYVTEMYEDIVNTGKNFTALATNNINHWNDFFTRVVANAVLRTMCEGV